MEDANGLDKPFLGNREACKKRSLCVYLKSSCSETLGNLIGLGKLEAFQKGTANWCLQRVMQMCEGLRGMNLEKEYVEMNFFQSRLMR